MATRNDLRFDGLFEGLAIHSPITFFSCVSNKYEHLVIRAGWVMTPAGHSLISVSFKNCADGRAGEQESGREEEMEGVT